MLSQKDVMVEGEAQPAGGGNWNGETGAQASKAGEYVYAVGVATLVHDAWPTAVQNVHLVRAGRGHRSLRQTASRD